MARQRSTTTRRPTSETSKTTPKRFLGNLERGQRAILAVGALAGAVLSIYAVYKLVNPSPPSPSKASDVTISSIERAQSDMSRKQYCVQKQSSSLDACL